MIKRILIILGATLGGLISLLVLLAFLGTSSVDLYSYFDAEYYHQTLASLDSAKQARPEANDSLMAGFARCSITPSLGHPNEDYAQGKFNAIPLAGYGARNGQPARGIHDSIFVKAVALKVAQQTIIFVSADLLIMPPNIVDSVTARLEKKGISREQVLYSATHTHSSLGGWGIGYVGEMFAGKEHKGLETWLAQQICRVIISAIEDLKPARIGTGNFAAADYTSNRLIGASGVKNNDFSFITLEQINHKKAIIGSYSAHATTLGADNWDISADYPGYWARRIESTSADYALFFAGSVGSQSPSGEGNGFDKAKHIGEALADSLNVQLTRIRWADRTNFSFLSLKMKLPDYHIRITDTRNLTTYLSDKLLPFQTDVYLQGVRLGNMVWITTPCDFSGEYALQLKHALRSYAFDANITSFNGGYVGYIVPGRYFYLDEYEPKVMGWYGPNMGDYTMDMIRQLARALTHANNI